MLDDWRDQWERVEIGLSRVRAVYAGRAKDDSADAVYDLYSFYINCMHLADWLTSPEPPVLDWEKVVKKHIEQSESLRVCRDFANRAKHFKLTRSWISADAGHRGQSVNIVMGSSGDSGTVKHAWTLGAGSQSYDALELGERCVDDWRKLLSTHGLL